MAASLSISSKELIRQASLVFEGKTYKIFLAEKGITGYTAENTKAQWESIEISGNGYAAVTGTIATGSYDGTSGRYEIPEIEALFTASGDGFSYDSVILAFGSETYVHSVTTEDPPIALLAAQSKRYRFNLFQDDIAE